MARADHVRAGLTIRCAVYSRAPPSFDFLTSRRKLLFRRARKLQIRSDLRPTPWLGDLDSNQD